MKVYQKRHQHATSQREIRGSQVYLNLNQRESQMTQALEKMILCQMMRMKNLIHPQKEKMVLQAKQKRTDLTIQQI